MSAYDVQIGKLISGKRELDGNGSYILCTPDRKIIETNSIGPNDGIMVSSKQVEDSLYKFCKSALSEYIAEGKNNDVYTFSIFTDTAHGNYVIYINNLEDLNLTVEEHLEYNRKRYLEKKYDHYNKSREQLYQELKYAEGDYPFMYEEIPGQLEDWLRIFSCISMELHHNLTIEQSYIFEKTLFDSQLFLIAIDVIYRLEHDLKQLNRTNDFIAYVSAADGVGGDLLTTSQLLRRCVREEQLYKAMPDVKEKDEAFQAAVQAVQQKPLQEQVLHWVTVIEQGEFSEGSPYSFWKTDYEAYEQLIGIGEPAISCIREHLSGELNQNTRLTLETVLSDLGKEF